MANNKIVAMILAGGKGTRLEALTKKIAKPAVSFGGRYRIIDFPLSNCANSQITTVGVVMQYESIFLDQYVGNGEKWGLNGIRSLTSTLSPRQTEEGLSWYKGTADAIYQNLDFLDSQSPEYVLILSGDHIYGMTYNPMLEEHIKNKADVTICSKEIPIDEASRFGIIIEDEKHRIIEFQEKPNKPKSNIASMGIYIFTYKTLKKVLIEDAKDTASSHDFGKNVLVKMLNDKKRLFSYRYHGYWKDVGTIKSLHEANIDLLGYSSNIELQNVIKSKKLFSEDTNSHPEYIGKNASVSNCIINQGAVILGSVKRCVISNEVFVDEGAYVENSVLMPGCHISKGARIYDSVVANDAYIGENVTIRPKDGNVELISGRRLN